MDLITIYLDENRTHAIRKADELSDDDVLFILKRQVFNMEQSRLAKQVAGELNPQQKSVSDAIRKRLMDRKGDS